MATDSNETTRNSRFVVSSVGCDNPIPVTDDLPMARRSSKHGTQEFFSSLIPNKDACRHGSRSNSIFCDFFKDPDRRVMDYSQEAAPRLEGYRNSLTMHSYMVRPSLDELHDSKQESHPSLATGKGQNNGGIKFGWIKGVYIRCLLNIWGVMLFLRMGWMTGQAGIILSIAIILLSTVVTVITTLSMSAICTNGDVRGGGAYYLISRSLGPEFGGAVGIILFLANAISGAMYVVGAGEVISDILNEYHKGFVEFPSGINDIRVSSFIVLILMMSITGIGMAFENKTQMLLLVILLVAMMDYFVGACLPPTLSQKAKGFVGWNLTVAEENMKSDFVGETFVSVFAIFFPSVTGILAGANISGDLKNPCSAIPKGTLLSILTTSLSYIAVTIWLGFTFVRQATGNVQDYLNGTFENCTHVKCDYGLLNDMQTMRLSSGFGPIIYAGTFAATLSSALVSIVSAPRILQALCVDGVIPWLTWLGKGYGADNDPRRALFLTFLIALGFTAIGELNVIAPYISNFFMAANGLINFSCFHASYVKSPGFRPGFKYYNLWLSLIGALLCAVIMFVMDWTTALITDVVAIAIYVYISKTCPDINWGSSFQGYSYRNALHYLNKLNRVEDHVKNYRPAILALTGNTSSRPQLVDLANLFTKDLGLLICGHVSQETRSWQRKRLLTDLNTKWLNRRKVKGFYSLVESNSRCDGVACMFQAVGIGKMKPNILMMGFKESWETCDGKDLMDYFNIIHETLDAHMSLCIIRMPGGTNFSAFFDSADGLPLLTQMTKTKAKKKMKKLRANASLETVFEEPLTPSDVPVEQTFSKPSHEAHGISIVIDSVSQNNDVNKPVSNGVVVDKERRKQKVDINVPDPPPIHILNAANIFFDKQPKGNIDVWWLYDTGGLTLLLPYILTTRTRFKDCKLRVFSVAQDDKIISDEQINLAALLHKFRIPFRDLTVLSSVSEPLHQQSVQRFETATMQWITKDEDKGNPLAIPRDVLNSFKKKTNQHLRLRELLERHSKDANMIVMTLPLPKKSNCPAPLYLAWLDILTYDMPPFMLVRGNQTNVLTFYS